MKDVIIYYLIKFSIFKGISLLVFNDYLLMISFISFLVYIITILLVKERELTIKLKLLIISIVIINLFNANINVFLINALLFFVNLIILWLIRHYFVALFALKPDLVASKNIKEEIETEQPKLKDQHSLLIRLPVYILLFNIFIYLMIYVTSLLFYSNLHTLNYNLVPYNLLIIILILIFSLFIYKVSKIEFNIDRSNKFQLSLFLFIVLEAINIIITNNLFSIISWFISSATFLGLIFFLDNFSKEYKLIKPIFRLIDISIIIFILTIFMIVILLGNSILNSINISNLISLKNNFITGFLIFGVALLGSIIPFSLKNFKIFFQDNSITGLLLYSIILFSSSFFIFRLGFALTSDIFIILIILFAFSIITICLSSLYLCLELFSSYEGFNHSIKTIFGYYLIINFNIGLILLSFSIYIPGIEYYNYMSNLLFLIIILELITLFIIYLFVPLISKFEDDFHLIGPYYFKFKFYNLFFIIPGLVMIFLIGYPYIYYLLLLFAKNPINSSFILSVNLTSILAIFILLILIILMILSTIYITLFSHRRKVYVRQVSEYLLSSIDLFLIITLICITGLASIIYMIFSQTLSFSF